jgi:hypothetical protein
MLLGKDASLYLHPAGANPITEVGTALPIGGKLVWTERSDMTGIALPSRSGTHISLHPSGQVHLKGGDGHRLTVAEVRGWFPVTTEFLFAYWFTPPVRSLPPAEAGAAQGFPVDDSASSLRLEVTICPPKKTRGRIGIPTKRNTLFVGYSPHYWVRLDGYIVPACDSSIFFLASPV